MYLFQQLSLALDLHDFFAIRVCTRFSILRFPRCPMIPSMLVAMFRLVIYITMACWYKLFDTVTIGQCPEIYFFELSLQKHFLGFNLYGFRIQSAPAYRLVKNYPQLGFTQTRLCLCTTSVAVSTVS